MAERCVKIQYFLLLNMVLCLKSIQKPNSVIIAWTGDKHVLSIQNIKTIGVLL